MGQVKVLMRLQKNCKDVHAKVTSFGSKAVIEMHMKLQHFSLRQLARIEAPPHFNSC